MVRLLGFSPSRSAAHAVLDVLEEEDLISAAKTWEPFMSKII